MATNSEQPPVPTVPPDAHFDEKAGIYGFFRRHQRKLLYTVGLFTLLTFSVGGPMLAAVRELFSPTLPMPTIAVGGQRVSLTKEDTEMGRVLANYVGALAAVLPPVVAGDDGQSELADVYAILRRVAITEGFDASFAEVDRAIEVERESRKLPNATQFALQRGFRSLAECRLTMREAMRIGQMLRLQTLLLDNSDAAVLKAACSDKEKVTFHVASFDEKALEEQLKAAGGMTDEDLKKWLDGKNDGDKYRMQAFDTNRVQLKIGAVMLADFDAAQWQEEALKDFKVGEEQLKKSYEQEKETRFKNEDKTYKPLEDEAVKAELTKLAQVDQTLNFLLQKIREKQNEALEPANAELRKTIEEQSASSNAVAAAKARFADASAKSKEKPDDAELKKAAEVAEGEVRQAEEAMVAREAARKAADEAVKTARSTFDFKAAFTALTTDKKGFVVKETTGKKNGDELKDLEADGVGLGTWAQSVQATGLRSTGDLCSMPGRSDKAAFLYQAADIDVRPLKAWDKLKPLAEGAYYTEKAKTEAEAKKKVMEETLLQLAKAKMPEKVAEIEGKREATVAEKLAAWTKRTNDDLAQADRWVRDLPSDTQAGMDWQNRRTVLAAELAKAEDKKKEIEAEVQKQIDADIALEAKKHHDSVLAAAAGTAGFTVAEVGPYPRELPNKPRFDKAYSPTIVFLFRNHAEMKAGESTGIVRDETNRLWLVGCCTKVESLVPGDIERREFEMLRSKAGGFLTYASMQTQLAYRQAFTKEAIEARYSFVSASGQKAEEKKPEEKK